jgi:GNAT superfamily N-acetyltransferase
VTVDGGRAPARPPLATRAGLHAPAPAAQVAPCDVADLPHVYGLALSAFGALPGRSRRRLVETLIDDVVFVARSGGRPVGYVALGRAPENAVVVDQFLVAPGHELSGIGDDLLVEAEGWGAAEHARTLRVVVGESDWTARAFYRRRGFAPVGRDVFELPLSR